MCVGRRVGSGDGEGDGKVMGKPREGWNSICNVRRNADNTDGYLHPFLTEGRCHILGLTGKFESTLRALNPQHLTANTHKW